MNSILLIVLVTAASVGGDYMVKLASNQPNGLTSQLFLAGTFFYGAPAVGWFFLMRQNSLAMIGVGYSGATIIILTALGTIMFKEAFGLREAIGTTLALASIGVMAHRI